MKSSSSLSRREKLLLGLLTSTLVFSASFSYGAVNQSKVDSIMQTINTAANNFSSQADRDTYYQRVYTGLSDAIDMLAVVRNNVGAMMGTEPVTVPPVTPPSPPTGGANPLPVTVTNPIADYPIPPPCPAGVKIMKEIATGHAQPRMTVYNMTAYPSGIIYKLPTPFPGAGRLEALDNSYGLGLILSYTKISPYPCDFYLGPEEDPDTNADNACVLGGGMVQFTITTRPFFWERRTYDSRTCNLQQGQTYYINMIPRQSSITKNKIPKNPPNAPSGILTEFRGPDGIDKYWGIYDTFEEYAATRTTQNSTSENPETLRQKVINDYQTKGSNTDNPLKGITLTPPVNNGGDPVVVREGPWEKFGGIFCPDTLAKAQQFYPDANDYWWTNVVSNSNDQTSSYWWNVKDKNKLNDGSLPATCTTNKEFIKHDTSYSCDLYICRN